MLSAKCSQKVEPGFDLTLRASPRLYDGRFANNGWLQELPHPVTTQSWGNSAVISPSTALGLGCKEGQILTVKVGGSAIDHPGPDKPGGRRAQRPDRSRIRSDSRLER